MLISNGAAGFLGSNTVFGAKPVIGTEQLFQSQVHVSQVETGHHGNLIYDENLSTMECGFHHLSGSSILNM